MIDAEHAYLTQGTLLENKSGVTISWKLDKVYSITCCISKRMNK